MKKGGIDRRRFLQSLASIGGGVLLGGGIPLPQMASAKTKFTIASTGGSWGDAVKKIFVEDSGFRKKFDLDVDYEFNIDSVVVAKALTNKNNPIFDVSSAITAMAVQMHAGGALEPELDFDVLTNYSDIASKAKIGKYFVGYVFTCMTLVYNTKYVKKPESFKDLWDPKYKGRISFSNYKHVGSSFLYSINRLFGGNDDNVMPGIEAFAELIKKQKAVPYDNTDHGMKLFQQEEIWLAPFWQGRALQLQGMGLPIDFIFVKDWLPYVMGFPVLKNTKGKRIAMEFINVTLDPGRQLEFLKTLKQSPTNLKCKIPKEFERVRVGEKDLDLAAEPDWNKIVLNIDKNMELWNKHVLGA